MDLFRINEVIASDLVRYLPVAPQADRRPEGFKGWIARLYEAFDLEVPLKEILAEDERTVTKHRVWGAHRGRLVGIPPASDRVEITGTRLAMKSGTHGLVNLTGP